METKSRSEYSILNILTGVGGYILNTIVGFVCRIYFVKCLSADYLGVNGLFTNVLSMLSLAELGIGNAIVYALYKPLAENDEDKIASLVSFYAKAYRTIGIVIAILGLILLPSLDIIITEIPNIDESIYLLYLINLFNTAFTYFFSYRTSLLIASQRNYIVTGFNYIVTIIQSVIQILVLILTKNYLLYLLIQSFGIFIYNFSISRIAEKIFPYIKSKNINQLPKEEKKSLFNNIKDLTLYKLSGLLVNSTDNILITFFDGLSITGIASNYTLLVNTLNSLLAQVFNGLTASVGNHNATNDNENKFSLFKTINLLNFWLFGWGAIGIYICTTDLVNVLFGNEYVLDKYISFVLALNFYTVGMQNAIWTYKQTTGLFKYGRFSQCFTAFFNIVFSILLGNKFGLFGILIATFFARLLTNLWYDPYVVFKFVFGKPFTMYILRYFKFIFILLFSGCISLTICNIITCSNILVVLFKMFVCSFIVNFIFIIFFYKTKELQKIKFYIFNISKKFLKISL